MKGSCVATHGSPFLYTTSWKSMTNGAIVRNKIYLCSKITKSYRHEETHSHHTDLTHLLLNPICCRY